MRIGIVCPESSTERAVSRALEGTDHEIRWRASSGAEALRRLQADDCEGILLSVAITDMSAQELTRRALATTSCGVLLIAEAATSRVSVMYEAMGAGALDVVSVPAGARGPELREALLNKLRTVGRLLGHTSSKVRAVDAKATSRESRETAPFLIAIGASTGGPQALLTVLAGLPKNLPAAIVIVQHVDSEFSAGLAAWLQDGSGIRVEIARAGSAPIVGASLLASSKDHLIMTSSQTFRYTAEPQKLVYRPSVDVLFTSLVQHWHKPGAAVLLTGMGRDGADGLGSLRKAGWHTIAQDEASSVVYGMPRAAAQLGAASKILPLPAIAGELASLIAQRHARRL